MKRAFLLTLILMLAAGRLVELRPAVGALNDRRRCAPKPLRPRREARAPVDRRRDRRAAKQRGWRPTGSPPPPRSPPPKRGSAPWMPISPSASPWSATNARRGFRPSRPRPPRWSPGLVNLGRRPPLVSLADDPDLTQMVRMRALLDVAVPQIRAEQRRLSAELAASRRLAEAARADPPRGRPTHAAPLAKRQQAFAALETRRSSAPPGSMSGRRGPTTG